MPSTDLISTPPPDFTMTVPLLPGRVGKLNSESSIRKEMGRLYRCVLRGELDPSIYTKLIYGLLSMAKIIQGSDLRGRDGQITLEELIAESMVSR